MAIIWMNVRFSQIYLKRKAQAPPKCSQEAQFLVEEICARARGESIFCYHEKKVKIRGGNGRGTYK